MLLIKNLLLPSIILLHCVSANFTNILAPKPNVEYLKAIQHIFCKNCKYYLIVRDCKDAISDQVLSQNVTSFQNTSLVIAEINEGITTFPIAQENADEADFTLIFLTKWYIYNMEIFLEEMKKIPLWHRMCKTVVVLTYNEINFKDKIWLEKMFKAFWKVKILRVFIYFWVNNEMKIFMYNPFLYQYSIDISNDVPSELNNKLNYELHNLHGYPLNAYVFDLHVFKNKFSLIQVDTNGYEHYLGQDGNFLTTIRDVMNVTLRITRESETNLVTYLYKQKNITVKLAKDLLDRYGFDVWFTAVRPKVNMTLDRIFLHERDDFVFVVPTGTRIPQYLYLFYIIPVQLWICIFATITIIIIIFFFVSHTRKQVPQWRKVKRAPLSMLTLDIYSTLLNVSVEYINFHYPNSVDRLIFAMWMIFALLFTTAFQSMLTATLITPRFYPNIDTLSDLVKSNLTIHSGLYDWSALTESTDDVTLKLLDRIVPSNNNWVVEDMLKVKENVGFLGKIEVLTEFLALAIDSETGAQKYHLVAEHVVPSVQGYEMEINHPYYEEMLWIINKVYESGLYYKWKETNFGWADFKKASTNNHNDDNVEIKPMAIEHLQSAFFVWCLGIFICVLAFLSEIIYVKCFRKNKYL